MQSRQGKYELIKRIDKWSMDIEQLMQRFTTTIILLSQRGCPNVILHNTPFPSKGLKHYHRLCLGAFLSRIKI